MKERGTVLSIEYPRDLLARAKKVNEIFHTKTAQLLREGLLIRVEQLEAKHREHLANKAADEAAEKAKREYRQTLRAAGSPISSSLPLTTQMRMSGIVGTRLSQDPTDALYTELARSIINAGDDKEEIRERVETAVAAVRRERPLTAPPENEIVTTLETYIKKLQKEGVEPLRTVDSLVGTVLDISKLKTSGATE